MAVDNDGVAAPAKRAHVNMMTDTIIANLPAENLRSVMRSVLTLYPSFTGPFEDETKKYLTNSTPPSAPLFESGLKGSVCLHPDCNLLQGRLRSMLGCGLVYESLPMFAYIVNQITDIPNPEKLWKDSGISRFLAATDGDLVQATTSIQKKLMGPSGTRSLTPEEKAPIQELLKSLSACKDRFEAYSEDYPFERGYLALDELEPSAYTKDQQILSSTHVFTDATINAASNLETFRLGDRAVPRLFCGLWQLSSPAWGVAKQSTITQQFSNYVDRGFTAFDMADHYGDAEVVFGRFRQSYPTPGVIFGATKYCVFNPIEVTPEVIQVNVTERCQRLRSDKVDLLQFHWQNYSDPQYLEALRLLEEDERVSLVGLCNFDTAHMEIILENGINIATNQVQFSLIDSRPTFKMGKLCEKYNVKLLTYGTLCGGWLADKWLGKIEPALFLDDVTPSQRKYYEMILSWGGWSLFQELLHALSAIASKHDVSIANVATRWVLDFPYVGAVLVGSRMGVSARADDNLAAYGWHLDEADQDVIEQVMKKSRRVEVFRSLGDCGGEYR